jgi:RNA binding exosome subunit
MLEAKWRICSSDISLQAADMPCSNEQAAHEVAFDCLISRISDDLFVHKKAFLMSHILEIYKSLLPKDVSENYQSTRLQCKLASYYGSSITIQPQKATSSADCSVFLNSTLSGVECNKNLLMHPE